MLESRLPEKFEADLSVLSTDLYKSPSVSMFSVSAKNSSSMLKSELRKSRLPFGAYIRNDINIVIIELLMIFPEALSYDLFDLGSEV